MPAKTHHSCPAHHTTSHVSSKARPHPDIPPTRARTHNPLRDGACQALPLRTLHTCHSRPLPSSLFPLSCLTHTPPSRLAIFLIFQPSHALFSPSRPSTACPYDTSCARRTRPSVCSWAARWVSSSCACFSLSNSTWRAYSSSN